MHRDTAALHLRADIFKALGHPTRLWIIEFLAEGPRSVAEIANEMEGGLSAISQHLAMLRQYGLIVDERRGRQIYYSIATPSVLAACAALDNSAMKEIVLPPKQRRGSVGASSGMMALLIVSLSVSSLLFAAFPYVARILRPAPPPRCQPMFDRYHFANRLEKQTLPDVVQCQCCACRAQQASSKPAELQAQQTSPKSDLNLPIVQDASAK